MKLLLTGFTSGVFGSTSVSWWLVRVWGMHALFAPTRVVKKFIIQLHLSVRSNFPQTTVLHDIYARRSFWTSFLAIGGWNETETIQHKEWNILHEDDVNVGHVQFSQASYNAYSNGELTKTVIGIGVWNLFTRNSFWFRLSSAARL